MLPISKIIALYQLKNIKHGGLDLSRHWKKVGLNSRENLDTFKILVSTIEKSQLRSRNLDFVSTPPSSLKSLNRDREIC